MLLNERFILATIPNLSLLDQKRPALKSVNTFLVSMDDSYLDGISLEAFTEYTPLTRTFVRYDIHKKLLQN